MRIDRPPLCTSWDGELCNDRPVLWIYVRRVPATLPYCRRHGERLMAADPDGTELRRDDDATRETCSSCARLVDAFHTIAEIAQPGDKLVITCLACVARRDPMGGG